MIYDRARLKQDVKLSMKGTSPSPILVTLLFSVVVSVGSGLINGILGRFLTGSSAGSFSDLYLRFLERGYEVEEALEQTVLTLLSQGPGAIFGAVVGGAVLSVIVSLWSGAMGVGYEGWCLSMVRRENPPLGRIFCALPQIVQVLLTRVFTGIFEALWALLLVLGYAVVVIAAALIDVPVLTVLLILAGIVALILGIIWVTMRYALVDFVLLDKGLSGMDAIRESKRLMQGNIGKGFVLQLSFFGWELLAIVLIYAAIIAAVLGLVSAFRSLSVVGAVIGLAVMVAALIGFAVLMLWLRPYTTGAMAKFYDWACVTADGFHSAPGCGSGSDGWSQPTDYTWTSGPTSGTGTGSAPGSGNSPPPRPPRSPRDDPWD